MGDGIYYRDVDTFVLCSNDYFSIFNCAPGTQNFEASEYESDNFFCGRIIQDDAEVVEDVTAIVEDDVAEAVVPEVVESNDAVDDVMVESRVEPQTTVPEHPFVFPFSFYNPFAFSFPSFSPFSFNYIPYYVHAPAVNV